MIVESIPIRNDAQMFTKIAPDDRKRLQILYLFLGRGGDADSTDLLTHPLRGTE
jgi:hypothetical protein